MTPSVVDPAKARPGDLIGYRKDGRPIRLQAGGHTNPFRSQYNFRGRDDGFGLNTTSGWKALSGVDWSQDVDTTFRVRIGIQETAAAAIIASAQLFYSLNGGTWTAITTTSAVVKGVASAQFNEGDAVTSSQLTGGVGPFINGSASEDGSATDLQLLSQRTEWEYALQIVGVDVANNDIIGLRVTAEDYGVSDTNIPAITVVAGAPPVALGGIGSTAGAATGSISVVRKLLGIGSVASDATGAFVVARPLTAVASAAAHATGDLTVTGIGGGPVALDAIGSAAASATGTFRIARALTGIGSAAAFGSGSLSVARALAGTGSVVAAADGSLKLAQALMGMAPAASAATGALTVTPPIGGGVALNGVAPTSAAASGTLRIARALIGTGAAAADSGGSMVASRALAGVAAASAAASGALSIQGLALVNLTFTALAPVLGHGPPLSPAIIERVAFEPALVARLALTPELATRKAGEPALGHGDVDHVLGHGDVEIMLGHGQPGQPTT